MLPSTWKKGTSLRLGLVIFSTSAPYSARMRVMMGPAMMRQSSRTLMPSSTFTGSSLVAKFRGQGGVSFSRLVTDQGGNFMLVMPFTIDQEQDRPSIEQETYMRGLEKLFMLQRRNTGLTVFRVEIL